MAGLVLKIEPSPEFKALIAEIQRLQENSIATMIETLRRDYRLTVDNHGEVKITKRNYGPAPTRSPHDGRGPG